MLKFSKLRRENNVLEKSKTKKKERKKLLSVLMIVCMLLTLTVFSMSAIDVEEGSDVSSLAAASHECTEGCEHGDLILIGEDFSSYSIDDEGMSGMTAAKR